MPTKYLIATLLCVGLALILIQTKHPLSSKLRQERINQAQQFEKKIQTIIDKSNDLFQTAEAYFEEKNYQEARRAYAKAVNSIFETGIDISLFPRLKEHLLDLNDRVVRRQNAVSQEAFSDALASLSERPQGCGSSAKSFSTTFTHNKNREWSENLAKAKSAIAKANLDFMIEPDASIQQFIYHYRHRGRGAMKFGLCRSGRYLPMVREIFKQEGVPQDLVWMAQVESAWSPKARSWVAAVGLWQFIPSTGKRFGLMQNDWIDQRMSFEGATRACATYLNYLGERYQGNWGLALAGYNAGENAVDRAITKAGTEDFWKIRELELLPQETQDYVPNILATIVIAKNPERYGFHVTPDRPLYYDTVLIKSPASLRLVADAIDGSVESLMTLNPELRRGITPPGMSYLLRIPFGKRRILMAMLRRIPEDRHAIWRMITAREEDTFAIIARHTNVSEKVLATVNSGILKAGEKVIIPVGGRRHKSPMAFQ